MKRKDLPTLSATSTETLLKNFADFIVNVLLFPENLRPGAESQSSGEGGGSSGALGEGPAEIRSDSPFLFMLLFKSCAHRLSDALLERSC